MDLGGNRWLMGMRDVFNVNSTRHCLNIVVPKATDNTVKASTTSRVISPSSTRITIVCHQVDQNPQPEFIQPIQRENKILTSLFDYV
jgi:hypothetical protein